MIGDLKTNLKLEAHLRRDLEESIPELKDLVIESLRCDPDPPQRMKIFMKVSPYLAPRGFPIGFDLLPQYLADSDAQSTYLSKTDAQDTYLSKSDAQDTYLSKSDAQDTYLSKTDAQDTYLSKSEAQGTYLKQSDHASTALHTLGSVVPIMVATGSSTGTGSSQTIAHNLGAVPHIISIVPTASGASVSGLYANSTNFYVTVTRGETYNWCCVLFL
ncbi:MAG: hypothetical protein QHG98_07195 [Methanothrix sp.]|nr:hypothetical protein [Methanothrix sp.]